MFDPPVDFSYEVLLDEPGFAVVSKSGNLPCHPAGNYRNHTLEALLRADPRFSEVHFVNRLDRETSGIVLVAKDAPTASLLGRALMQGRFAKEYLALTEGPWRHGTGEYTARGVVCPASTRVVRKLRVFLPEGTSSFPEGVFPRPSGAAEPPTELPDPPQPRLPSPGTPFPGAQTAETRFLPVREENGLVLLRVRPVTGRPHQIRATLKALGYLLVGDKLYGPDGGIYARLCGGVSPSPEELARLRLPRQALHASRLVFPHPYDRGRTVDVASPLSADIAALLSPGGTPPAAVGPERP